MEPDWQDDHTVVGRALAVLHAVADGGPDLSLGALARITGLPKPTARRLAARLVRGDVLLRTPLGYSLGPGLSAWGHTAETHVDHVRWSGLLAELYARHGGLAWYADIGDHDSLRLAALVCDPGFDRVARAKWPPATAASLASTAGGHIILATRPQLVERVARAGLRPMTPKAPRDLRRLGEILRRTRDEGVATESEQSMLGWSCAATKYVRSDGGLIVIGVTVPAGAAPLKRLARSLTEAVDTMG